MIQRPIRHRHRWLWLALAVLAHGCAPATPSLPAHPPMWEVRDDDTRILIIGSVHQLPAALDWSGGAVADAAAAADELWLELSPAELGGAAALFERMRQDEPVPPLGARLPAGDAARIRTLARTGGLADEAIDRSESWALAIAAGRGALADSDFTGDNGVEARLIATMERRGKPIIGLESAATQLDAFDGLPAAVQNRLLAVIALRSATTKAEAQQLVTAWSRGDEAALTQIAAQGLNDTPELVEPLVHARNRRWALQIQQRMQRPGTIMLAVGTGHLVGDQSLIELLQGQGWQVTRLSS